MYFSFAIVVGSSLIATIAGTLFTSPTNPETLANFYKTTRPFGFWKPVLKIINLDKSAAIKKENRWDIIAICFALPWQIVLFLTLMTFILQRWDYLAVLTIVLILLSAGLYYFP